MPTSSGSPISYWLKLYETIAAYALPSAGLGRPAMRATSALRSPEAGRRDLEEKKDYEQLMPALTVQCSADMARRRWAARGRD